MAGPRHGAIFPLAGGEFSIGRDPSNQIQVADIKISRRHCLIDGQYQLRDLESRNGTFVSGMPVKERALEHGDQIRVGGSTFLFQLREDEVPLQPAEPGDWLTESFTEMPPPDLRALVEVGAALGSVRGLQALEQKLLESLADITSADRGAIILVGKNWDDFTSIFGWDRFPGRDDAVHLSRPAIDRALREGTPVVLNAELSLIAVPLKLFDRTVGVIYLDTANPKIRFSEDHLQLLTAMGPMAALALDNARRLEWLEGENERLHTEIDAGVDMVGESPSMKDVYRFIAKAAPSDSTVLVGGESGTGKELVARAIHRNSARAGRPFVAINCAALTEALLESEMFGHEKGAFTGAVAMKKGKLEAADTGTFFLDEVGELSPVLQAKLLRVLQEREFERVGGTRTIKLDVRLIAATNRNLKLAVKERSFREDLYYRLNVVSVTLPPLRERREDISLLATYFLAKHGAKSKLPLLGISPEARACLLSYDWPGNVRELENAVERAVVLRSGDVILPEDLPDSVLEAQGADAPLAKYHATVQESKKQLILKALAAANGNYTEAAKTLGVHPNYLHRLVRNLNIRQQ